MCVVVVVAIVLCVDVGCSLLLVLVALVCMGVWCCGCCLLVCSV